MSTISGSKSTAPRTVHAQATGQVVGPVPPAPASTSVPAVVSPAWQVGYARRSGAVDFLGLAVAMAGYAVVGDAAKSWPIYVVLAATTVLLVAAGLSMARAWDSAVLGQGSEEYSRLLRGWVTCLIVLGLAGLALEMPEVRPWAFGVLPVAGALSAAGRFALRKRLHRGRSAGRCMRSVLAIGSGESVAQLVERTRRAPHNGWLVTAACTPSGLGGAGSTEIGGVPVVGDLDSVASLARSGRFEVISVSHPSSWTPSRLRQLSWDLEGSGIDLVVDPGLMEIAGPRLHVASVDGLPLLRLSEPRFTGFPRVVKSVTDRIAAAFLLVLLSPLMIGLALAVRADGGPALFLQTRVGQHGKKFRMVKFRSMVVDAEALRAKLAAENEGAGPLFKMRSDPRVTAVGARLRRYSLDELPQLFNVITGSMSLVGPRPPLPSEVESYGPDAARRLLVRPGLTGLWQVSGRSDLSWDESIQLDLRYVENWTLALDALILWKTVGAVVRSSGAY